MKLYCLGGVVMGIFQSGGSELVFIEVLSLIENRVYSTKEPLVSTSERKSKRNLIGSFERVTGSCYPASFFLGKTYQASINVPAAAQEAKYREALPKTNKAHQGSADTK